LRAIAAAVKVYYVLSTNEGAFAKIVQLLPLKNAQRFLVFISLKKLVQYLLKNSVCIGDGGKQGHG